MPALFSVPAYPKAVSYNLQYSDPLSGNPNAVNRFGPWSNLVSAATSPSNIFDPGGSDNLRVYRAQPTIFVNGNTFTLPYSETFMVEQRMPGFYKTNLFDAQISNLLGPFRDFIGDYGTSEMSSTDINLDTGSGVGLIQPDGVTTTYSFAVIPDAEPPTILEYSVEVVKNNLSLLLNTDYVVSYEKGTIQFATAPQPTDTLTMTYKECKYTNRMLCSALQVAIDQLAEYNINGYGISDDNNVKIVNGVIGNNGLRPIIFALGQKILNRATIRIKSEQARAYKTDNFSIDTAPGRLIDGMSSQSIADFAEIRTMANQYIKTATSPMVRDAYDSFFDPSGLLPGFSVLVAGYYGVGYGSAGWL